MTGAALWPLALVTAGSFVSTNVDNLMLTSAQLAVAPAGRARAIVRGQITGAVLVVAAAALGGTALLAVPARWVGLLGLVPIGLGLRELVHWRRAGQVGAPDARSRWPVAGGFITAALVTIGSSADNLTVYIPLLRKVSVAGGALVLGELVVLDLVLCAGALLAGGHPAVVRAIERGGPVVRPLLYLAIGVIVVLRAGTV